ncbi:MAG: hypothetical protein GX217_00675 [Clostridiaceae bacterium]|nr:hypothetical protein [Clostridiaceae bacterium]
MYIIKSLENSPVLDGFIQNLLFCDGERNIELHGSNLDWCGHEPELYPNTMIVVKILEVIGELLIPESVVRQCFLLEKED